jgi:branched-chain amino acid transport system substrate-binding protein
MSNPAEKIDPLEYAPKRARDAQRQGNPGAAQSEWPNGGERPPSERDVALLRKSLEPTYVDFPQRTSSWPEWLPSIGWLAVALVWGVVIGVFFINGAPWRKAHEDNTTVTVAKSIDTPTAPLRVSSPAPALPITSAAPQSTNVAQPAAGLPVVAAPQSSNAAPARVAAIEAPSASTPSIRGVTDTEIRFGISAPFTGAAKELGNQMKLGIETAFDLGNDAGGINGRQVKLAVADDGYEPTRTADTMKQLFEKQQVFGFVGNVGTPTAVVALPYALQRHALFFGAFTGADLLRRDPPDRYVFNYRASYAEETEAAVNYLVKLRHLRTDQIAVFAQHDAFGDAGFAGVAKAMRGLRGDDSGILRLDYERNTVDVDNAIASLRAHKPPIKAVVMVPTYRAAAKFIEKTRDSYPGLIYTSVSFVGSTALANELMLLGPRFANGVIVTQVVPAVDSYSTAILKYRNALAKYFPGEPPDYVSLEGYVDGMLLLEGMKRTGQKIDTEGLVDALETVRNFDLGIGTPITFSQSEHQGSHKVWGTQLDDHGRYQSIDLQ